MKNEIVVSVSINGVTEKRILMLDARSDELSELNPDEIASAMIDFVSGGLYLEEVPTPEKVYS